MKREWKFFWFLIYVVVGAYLVNSQIEFLEIPEFVVNLESWIIIFAGILLLFAAVNIFRIHKANKTVLQA